MQEIVHVTYLLVWLLAEIPLNRKILFVDIGPRYPLKCKIFVL